MHASPAAEQRIAPETVFLGLARVRFCVHLAPRGVVPFLRADVLRRAFLARLMRPAICLFFGKRDKKPIEADEDELGDFSDGDEDNEGMDLDDVKPDPDDGDDEKPPPWWLSLSMGLAVRGAEIFYRSRYLRGSR